MAIEIKLTTLPSIEGRKIKKVLERQEVSSQSLAQAEINLVKKVSELSRKVEWVVDIKCYQRANGKFLLSGTPIICED